MDKDKEVMEKVGARPQADQALVASDGAPAGLHPAGVDPSRIERALLMVAPSFQGGHSHIGAEIAELLGAPFPLSMTHLRPFAIGRGHIPYDLWPWLERIDRACGRDSDGSPKGGDACGSVEDDSAVPPKSGNRPSPEGTPHV